MTAQETADWLEVAFEAVAHIPLHIFEAGCRAARQTCTHHSQIVPAIVKETREELAWYNRPKVPPALRLVAPVAEVPPLSELPLPDPETLMPSLRRMGLNRGWIVERGGRLEWAEGDAA
ncbi:hypothetical protein JI59_18540 [Novosphingobium pentaromativorans US6-1]|nr:hypothetical protein JI59_18540 [Novosphingobium pentaromativorans US6-1]